MLLHQLACTRHMMNVVQYTQDAVSISHRSQYVDADRIILGWIVHGRCQRCGWLANLPNRYSALC